MSDLTAPEQPPAPPVPPVKTVDAPEPVVFEQEKRSELDEAIGAFAQAREAFYAVRQDDPEWANLRQAMDAAQANLSDVRNRRPATT